MTSFPYELLVPRFRRLVLEKPDKLAVHAASGDLTRRDLDQLSDGYARAFAGVGAPGQPIAFLVDDSIRLVSAAVGALKLARPFCILDSAHPIPRIREILEDLGPAAIAATASTLEITGEAGAAVPVIRADLVEATSEGFDVVPAEPDTPATIVYTSGSTGRPKGVVHSHGSLGAMIEDARIEVGLLETDRLAPLFAVAFASSIISMLRALLAGPMLWLHPLEDLNLGELADWLDREQISVIQTIPSLFRSLSGSLPPGRRLSSVRVVTLAGEPVMPNDLSLFREFWPADAQMIQYFGASEAGGVLVQHLDSKFEVGSSGIPAGRPIRSVNLRLADDDGNDVPPGTSGEMVVESSQVSLGYWRAPELTSERFSPGRSTGVRIFRTGDRGIELSEGRITFLGRTDERLKIRGFRIDPLEVELALLSDPAIRHAAVVGKPGPDGVKQLVAYLVVDGSLELPVVRAKLADRLPAFAVPSLFHRIDALPQTATGKVDRRALESREDPAESSCEPGEHAGDGIEAELRRLCCEVLHLPSVGLDEGFFDRGGDSLRAAALFGLIERVFGRAYPVTVIMEAQTVRELAAVIRKDLQDGTGASGGSAAMAVKLEPVVLDAWRRALGRPDLRADADFFDSGGDASACMSARDEIAEAIGRRFPLAMFVGFRTARELASALGRPRSEIRIERCVELIRKGAGLPFFCFSGKGSDILSFRPLAERLDSDAPVYGVRGFGLGIGWLPPADFDLLLELAIDEIQEIQPRGPYRFAGHSSGGQFALETARRLEERGESTELVAMIDTVHPGFLLEESDSFSGRLGAWWRKVRAISAEPRDHLRDWLVLRRLGSEAGELDAIDHSNHPDRWRNVGDIYLEALAASEVRPWNGPVVLFSAELSLLRRNCSGWEESLPRLEVVSVSGGHVSVLEEPNVGLVAREIAKRMSR